MKNLLKKCCAVAAASSLSVLSMANADDVIQVADSSFLTDLNALAAPVLIAQADDTHHHDHAAAPAADTTLSSDELEENNGGGMLHSHFHAHGTRADSHAPIGIMGDHKHAAGEVMLSYRYMRMEMEGNRNGNRAMSTDQVLDLFPIAPLSMTMEMHMFGVMYAPIEEVTLMAMIPYLNLSMDHVNRAGVNFTTEADGIGDIKFGGLASLLEGNHHNITGKFSISAPTGDIDVKDDTPLGNIVLPYPMQLGSGTVDALPGITYTYIRDRFQFGTDLGGVIRMNENDRDYRLGHRFDATSWLAWAWCNAFSTSVRLDYSLWGDVSGADSRLNPNMVPTAVPQLRGGERLDLLFGFNLLMIEDGPLKGHRFAVEGGFPVHQDLDGPQLETDWLLTVGWQYAF